MPVGCLRSLLQEFAQGADANTAHDPNLSYAEMSACVPSGQVPRGLGRHLGWRVRAASFLDSDADWSQQPRTSHTSFTKHAAASPVDESHESDPAADTSRVHDELQRLDRKDQKMVKSIENKVDNQLHDLREEVERKLDNFFKTMREAYGVPFGAPGLVPPANGAAFARAGSSCSSMAADGQPLQDAQVKFRLPDLPPGKHATIHFQRQPSIAAGVKEVGPQQEALDSLLKRLDFLTRRLAGEPIDSAPHAHASPSLHRRPAEKLDDIYQKLETIQDNLNGASRYEHARSEDAPIEADLNTHRYAVANVVELPQEDNDIGEAKLDADLDGYPVGGAVEQDSV